MSVKGVAAGAAAEKSGVRVPAWALVVLSIISVEAGAAVAKSLFDSVGPVGVIFIRTLLGSAMLWALARPRLTGYTRREWGWLIAYGVVIALNMLIFYWSIARIPLGIAVAIAFAGPLVLAVIHSRKPIDVLWVVLAGGGILLLTPLTSAALDPLGVALSLLCAVLWGLYIILTGRVSRSFPGMSALAVAMGVAALITLPFGAPGALTVFTDWRLIAVALFVALLSSAIPFALEFIAMKTLPTRALSLLLALEPVAAALVGLVLLSEHLGLREAIGIGLVTIAAIATAYESR
ncbi:MAG: EamA family transporter [Candidatus Flexifilum sp.]|jgi:inner membrane transporter RhtA